jgi:hypothetical protein
VSSIATTDSRREKAAFSVGRYVMTRARRPRPIVASANAATAPPTPSGRSKPSVNRDEPLTTTAEPKPPPSIAQKIPEKPSSVAISQRSGSPSTAIGAP